jgi:hypothetical protein
MSLSIKCCPDKSKKQRQAKTASGVIHILVTDESVEIKQFNKGGTSEYLCR